MSRLQRIACNLGGGKMTKSLCKTSDCNMSGAFRGWCRRHYDQAKAAGVFTPRHRMSLDQRLLNMSELDDNGCWVWSKYKEPRGYGKINVHSEPRLAHRVSYEFFVGPIPDGLFLDHMCFNRACINPDHLRVVTNKQNMEHARDLRSNNTTGARNVYRCKRTGRWAVKVGHNGKHYWGGRHDTFAEAERVARNIRKELFTHDDYEAWEQARLEATTPYL